MRAQGSARGQSLDEAGITRREKTLRILSDCFSDWKFESKSRSRPFYKKVIERVINAHERPDSAALQEKICSVLKGLRFEVQDGADDDAHVSVRVVLCANDACLLKETAGAYRACLAEYVRDENKDCEERVTSALRGKYITLKDEMKRLNRSIVLQGTETTAQRDRMAELAKVLLKLEKQISEAEKIAREYGREISFLSSK